MAKSDRPITLHSPRSLARPDCPAYMPCATLKTLGGHKMLVRMQPIVQCCVSK